MKHLGFAAACLLVVSACGGEPEQQGEEIQVIRPAKIATAKAHTFDPIKALPGVTEATQNSELAFRVSGQIVELPVRAAHRVKKGDVIARLDDTDYRNTLADRQARYELAKADFERQQTLFNKKHVAESALDIARSSFQAAEAALKQAKDNVGYTVLSAPYDGRIGRVYVDNFENVQAKEPIAQFQSANDLAVVFNVPERLLVRLTRENTDGGHVTVEFDAVPGRRFDAWYREHEILPDAHTQSFKVKVVMARPTDINILSGMTATVFLDLSKVFAEENINSVLVPVEAVFEEQGQTWVWVLDDDNAAHKTAVTTKGIEGDSIRITHGLVDGARVIAGGVLYVREGQRVRPIVKERGL